MQGVRTRLFMAVKVANNENLNDDDSISRRRLVNVFRPWKRVPFIWRLILWKRIFSRLSGSSLIVNISPYARVKAVEKWRDTTEKRG